jgi:predicted Zn-dependent protease
LINLMLGVVAGAMVAAGGIALVGSVVAALILAPIAAIGTLLALTRRVQRRLDRAAREVEGHLRRGRVDRALAALEGQRPLARWQVRLGPALDAQIGMLLYGEKRAEGATRPHLERAGPRAWQAQAMLAASHYKRGRFGDMERVFERALKRSRKQSLLWATYAFCQWKRGRAGAAIDILARATRRLPADRALARNLRALQNRRRMRMTAYGPTWWSLHLESSRQIAERERRQRAAASRAA